MTDPLEDEALHEIAAALDARRGVYEDDLHLRLSDLAEAGGPATRALLVRALDSADGEWRLEAVQNLGLHYDLSDDPALLGRLREMLRADPEAAVRRAAASVLSIQSSWPDAALAAALRDDPDGLVRLVAFEALLKLAGLSSPAVRDALRRLKRGSLELSAAGVEAVLGAKADDLDRPG